MIIAMEEQDKMLMSVTSRMHNAEEEAKSLKRTDIQLGMDEAVQQMMPLNKEQKLATQRAAAKNTVIN